MAGVVQKWQQKAVIHTASLRTRFWLPIRRQGLSAKTYTHALIKVVHSTITTVQKRNRRSRIEAILPIQPLQTRSITPISRRD